MATIDGVKQNFLVKDNKTALYKNQDRYSLLFEKIKKLLYNIYVINK